MKSETDGASALEGEILSGSSRCERVLGPVHAPQAVW